MGKEEQNTARHGSKRRPIRKEISYSTKEWEQVQKYYHQSGFNGSILAYIRNKSRGHNKYIIPLSQEEKESINKLNNIGINLNQITAKIHAGKLNYSEQELTSVLKQLSEALTQLNAKLTQVK